MLTGMTFTRIVCPTDFSPGSEHALRFATTLALQHDSELIVLHSWYLPPSAYSLEYPFPPEVTQQIIADAQQRLDAALESARAMGAKKVSGALVSGIPASEITTLLDNRGADLCVIGTHGRTGIKRVLLGSVAEKVVRHAHCSVLVVPLDSAPSPFKSVLVPTDFSASAEYATSVAASLVDPHGTLRLLHCVELPVMYGAPFAIPLEYDNSTKELLAAEAAKLKTQTTAKIITTYRIGSPGPETLQSLDDTATDLVVTGSHGRTGVKRALLGSVAEKIVRHAGCPVLVARNPVVSPR
jgi:nucleotide-binding universal stress UspA family protein